MGFKIVDKTKKFLETAEAANDRALSRMSADIERIGKQTAPHDKGHLVASGAHYRIKRLVYRVIFNKEYAEAQEAGQMTVNKMRSFQIDKHWVTLKPGIYKFHPKNGKKAHYLRDAGQQISKDANKYLREEGSTIRI